MKCRQKADAIPSLDDDSGNVHSSPTYDPLTPQPDCLLPLCLTYKNTRAHTSHSSEDFIQQCLSLHRD